MVPSRFCDSSSAPPTAIVPEGFSVRLASERDADLVWQLVLRMVGPDERIKADRTQLAVQLQTGRTKCFLVQSDPENKAVGFCLASLAFDTWISQYLTLSALFVEPGHRGRHLCTALVIAACRYARDHLKTTQVECAVLQSNSHVAEVLQSFGFHNVTQLERSISFRLDSTGLGLALEAKLRAGIRLEGLGSVPGPPAAAYVVRPGTVSDAKDVLALIVDLASFQGCPNDVLVTAETLALNLESGMCSCVVAIETSMQRLIGMTVSWCFLTLEYGLMTHLEDIFINPQHRGVGVGKALLIGTCLWAKSQGATAIDLRTHELNERAQAVYKAMGFEEEAGRRAITDFRIEIEEIDELLARPIPQGIAFCF